MLNVTKKIIIEKASKAIANKDLDEASKKDLNEIIIKLNLSEESTVLSNIGVNKNVEKVISITGQEIQGVVCEQPNFSSSGKQIIYDIIVENQILYLKMCNLSTAHQPLLSNPKLEATGSRVAPAIHTSVSPRLKSCTQTSNSQITQSVVTSGQSAQQIHSISMDISQLELKRQQENSHLQEDNEVLQIPQIQRANNSNQNKEQFQIPIKRIRSESIDVNSEINELKPYIHHYRSASLNTDSWIKVKPWIEADSSTKREIRWDIQFALYKCMHTTCIFSTNDASKMEKHIDSHLEMIDIMAQANGLTRAERKMQIKCRECAYCPKTFNHGSHLVDHITKQHGNSIFQCANCFYRTIEMDNLIAHNEHYHNENGIRRILVCSGKRVINAALMKFVYNRFLEMSEQSLISCGECRLRYFKKVSLILSIN